MSRVGLFFILPLVVGVSGCVDDPVENVQQQMQNIREERKPDISNPPVFETVESFNYGAEKLRSPFMPPSLSARLAQEAFLGSQVVPDETRPKEHLEAFELTQLVMRGIIQEQTGERYALIEDPAGTLLPVRVGNYMGRNHGRIAEINERELNLIEIVPDGGRGYVERPTTILVPEA